MARIQTMKKNNYYYFSTFFSIRAGFPALIILGLLITQFFYPNTVEGKQKNVAPPKESHRFFSFEDAPYYTSPDKRIGSKLLIDSVKVGPTFAAMQHITFLPTAHIASHRHVYVTEVVYVLKGSLTLRIEKETKTMGPDTTAYIPPQTFHEYLNDSQDVCQFLQFFSPAGPEEEYRSWERPNDVVVAKPAKETASGTKNIVRPTMPPIPGSPRPVFGQVKDVSTPATGSFELQLKKAPPVVVAPLVINKSNSPQTKKK